MEKVSIVIPVYNGSKFLDKCMDSVLNQTYKNIEIILLDDGSSDNSLELIKEYVNKYDNVKFNTHKNVGLSETRNIGVKHITGDYVTYLDVDDYLDYDFIEKMIEDNKDYDIIIGGYRRVYEDGKIDLEYALDNKEWNRYKRVTVWAKLYKVSFLKKNKIVYPHERLFGEDVVYTMRCMSKTENVIIKKYIGYNNLINEESITHKNKDRILNDVPKMLNDIDDFIKNDKKFLNEKKDIVYFYYMKLFCAYLVEQSEFLEYEKLKKYYNESFGIIRKIFQKYNYKIHFTLKMCVGGELFKVNLMVNVFIIFEKLHCVDLFLKLLNKFYYKKPKIE